jgi:glutamate synthase (NADPH/NADH) small chain
VSATAPAGAARIELRLVDHKPQYDAGQALAEAQRCLYCFDAPCITACPTGIDIPAFIKKIATQNLDGSARRILSANLMGYSCARVCPVEVLCVGACVYNHMDRPPIQIGRLQRYAVETALDSGRAAGLFEKKAPNGKKVAFVGAGPASLACAGYLAIEGFACTVFEKRATPGGLNATGVAPYKMHVEGALREVDLVKALGVTIRTGVEVGRDVSAEDLLRDYDAVFLGVGLGADSALGVPGEDGPGVSGAVAWIERMKTDPTFSLDGVKHAAVVGGGNTAIDASRELAELGVDVMMLYRRTEDVMSGYAHEMKQAREDGVRLHERAVVKEFVRDASGKLVAARLEDGREAPCDLALLAIGQARLGEVARAFPGVQVDPAGRILADPATGRTGNPKVYAGGDALNGGKEVVNAAQEGKRAARAIAVQCGMAISADSPMMAGHV